jgi:hypothetical protein
MAPEDGSIVKKAAEEQKQLDAQQNTDTVKTPPIPTPILAPAVDSIYDPETKTVKAPGMEGGFFVGAPATPQAQSQTPSSPTPNIQDLEQRMKNLQEELNAYNKQRQAAATTPSTTPPAPHVKEPMQTPMFGVDVPQQAPSAPATAPKPPASPPPHRESMKTPMFGIDVPPVIERAPTPRASPQPQPQPQQPQQPVYSTQESPQPQYPQPQPQSSIERSASGYIALSTDGKGFALIMDHLTQKDIDQFSFMSGYLHEFYPNAMPQVHPAPMMKFAANHLRIDIMKALAKEIVCIKCNNKMPINSIQCPACKAYNRCPQCHNFVGGNNIFL